MVRKGHIPFRSWAQAERLYIRSHGKEKGLAMLDEDRRDVVREIERNKKRRRQ
jgi:hypothetical protein